MHVVRLCDQDGRIRGSYVYMVLAPNEGGAIHVKIGQSDKPLERLSQLLVAIPVVPDTFAFVKMPSRHLALRLERAMHRAFEPWSSHGEWFSFLPSDKAVFNDAWRDVFARHALPSWPLKWQKIRVKEYRRARQVKQALFKKRYASLGKAYQDFARDSARQ